MFKVGDIVVVNAKALFTPNIPEGALGIVHSIPGDGGVYLDTGDPYKDTGTFSKEGNFLWWFEFSELDLIESAE